MTRKLPTIFAIATLLAVFAAVAAGAGAGDLDLSFDHDGRKVLPGIFSANAVLVHEDGKIVIAGDTVGGDFGVLRLNPDGSRDGSATVDFGPQDRALAAALQPDGKLVVAGAGTPQEGQTGAVARFNPDGRLDSTFDGDGKKLLPLGTLEEVRSVIIQRDDRIVLAGRGRIDGNPSMAVTRLTPDGGNDGTTFTPVTFGSGLEAAAAALGPDGRIVFAGTDFLGGSRARIVLARYDVDGTLDDTFGSVGKVVYDTGGSDQAASVLVRADGKIVVAGTSATLGAPSMEAIRFNRDGGPDASFGSGGRGMPEFDGASAGVAAALQPDGKIVLAGTAVPPYTVALARLGADGALDRSFGSAGMITVDFDSDASGSALALQPDGKLLVGGQIQVGAVLARLMPDPPPPAAGGGAPAPAAATPRCAGRRATIVGTPGRDRLRGTRRADVIVALGGNDRVVAGPGRDIVCGGRGDDRLSGGLGRDRLLGGRGRDRLLGGAGRDRLAGGPGRDRTKS